MLIKIIKLRVEHNISATQNNKNDDYNVTVFPQTMQL